MSVFEKLFDWQKALVTDIEKHPMYGLFLDMGLGKTPISVALAEIHRCNKIMIVTLNAKVTETINTPGSWQQWCSQMDGNFNIHSKKLPSELSRKTNDVFVINYEALYKRKTEGRSKLELSEDVKRFIEASAGQRVCLILDESHKIKDASSKQSKALHLIKSKLRVYGDFFCSYLLTGTPFTSGYIDLYNQLAFLGCDLTKTKFEDLFCERGHIRGLLGWQQPIVGYKNVDKLFELVHKYAITIESKEVIQLPPQIFVNHSYPATDEFKLLTTERLPGMTIEKYLSSTDPQYLTKSKVNNPFYRNRDYPSEKWLAETSGAFWLRARQISIGFQGNSDDSKWYDQTRLKLLRKFLDENPNNYVLFYNYTPELLAIYEICESLGYKIDVYCGDIKSLTFYERFCQLPSEKKLTETKNIIIANFASGSTGKNWQEYNQCILFSVPLYDDYAQGLKRVHRTGQKNTVFYHTFYQNNWLDNGMVESLNNRSDYNEDMFKSEIRKINAGN